jgi:hypothetical protein
MHGNRTRLIAPGSTTGLAGVVVFNDEGKQTAYSHHGSDVLGDGKPHDAFDVLRLLECGGDYKKAMDEVRRRLGLPAFRKEDYTSNAKSPSLVSNFQFKTMNAQQLMALDLPKVPHVVPGLLPEGLTVFAGKPKMGKSWLTLATALAVACDGYTLGTIKVQLGEALYLGLEDTPRRLQNRLSILTDDVPEGLHLATELPRIDEGGLEFVSDWLEHHPTAKYVVIDTLARVKPRRAKNGDIYEEDALVGGQLQKLASKHHVSLVVVHHLRKAFAEDPFDAVSGSTGLTGAADAVLVLTRTRGQSDAVLHVTGRDLEEQSLALRFQPENGSWLLVSEAKEFDVSKEDKGEMDDAREWLRSQLIRGALPAQTLFKTAKAEGISERTLKRVKAKLEVKSKRETTGNKGVGGWLWYLEGYPDLQSDTDNDTLGTLTKENDKNTNRDGTPVTVPTLVRVPNTKKAGTVTKNPTQLEENEFSDVRVPSISTLIDESSEVADEAAF